MEIPKFPLKIRFSNYLQNRKKYSVDVNLHIRIHTCIGILCLLSLIETSILNHYPQARMLWICGIAFSLIFIELTLQKKHFLITSFITPTAYTLMVPIGILLSGSVLTPSILYSFLVILIVSLISKGMLRIIYVLTIIITVISFAIFEMKIDTQKVVLNIDRTIYIDWIFFFTTISLIMIWLIDLPPDLVPRAMLVLKHLRVPLN